jgi:glutathione S-transferase
MWLYYRPGTGRPMRVAWTLGELGLDYEAVAVSREQCTAGEHLARHPLGRVPALELADGRVLFESTAIVLAVADMHPEAGLTGPPGSALRGQVYEWSIFAMTELERPALAARPATAHVQDEFRTQNRQAAQLAAAAIARQLGDGEFLLGDSFTAADVVVGGVLAVVEHVGLLDVVPEPAARYLSRLQGRPAYARALERTESLLGSGAQS